MNESGIDLGASASNFKVLSDPHSEQKKPLPTLGVLEIVDLSREELQQRLVDLAKQNSGKELTYQKINSQFRGERLQAVGMGVFLGTDEDLVDVIQQEARNILQLNAIAKKEGMNIPIDYDWLSQEVEKVLAMADENVDDKDNIGLRLTAKISHSAPANPLNIPLGHYDVYANDTVAPHRHMMLSQYTFNLFKQARFAESYAAGNYYLNPARFCWVFRVGTPAFQKAAMDMDWQNAINNLQTLVSSLDDPNKDQWVRYPQIRKHNKARRAQEAILIMEYLSQSFPPDYEKRSELDRFSSQAGKFEKLSYIDEFSSGNF